MNRTNNLSITDHPFGNGLFKIIAEAIIRGLIKLIPIAGEAIDQATFGAKDAIQDAELQNIIRDIYIEVSKHNENFRPNGNDIEKILQELIESPSIQSVIHKLEHLDSSTLNALEDFILQIQEDIFDSVEMIRVLNESISQKIDRYQNTIENLHHDVISQQDNIHEILA